MRGHLVQLVPQRRFPCTCIVSPALILLIAIDITSYLWASYAGCAANYCIQKSVTPEPYQSHLELSQRLPKADLP